MNRRKLKVHHPMQKTDRYARNFYLFCDELIDKLKKQYDVEEHRYYDISDAPPVRIKPVAAVEEISLHDSDILIENDNNEFVIFSMSDTLHNTVLTEKNNSKLKKIFISQFYPNNIQANVKDDVLYNKKYSPWIYFQTSVINLEQFYFKRKYFSHEEFVDKMIFRGGVDHRKIVSYMSEKFISGPEGLASEKEYFEDVIKHKVGLSVGGRAEICYRDVEYMAVGIPFLRFTYQSRLLPDLIPNFHYIAVEPPSDLPLDIYRDYMPDDSQGTEKHAELLCNRFLEVKDDIKFLNYIARNARIYYETYLAPGKNVEYTIKLIKDNLNI